MLSVSRVLVSAALAVLAMVATVPAAAAPGDCSIVDGRYVCESTQPGTPGTPGQPGGPGGPLDPNERICVRKAQPTPPPGWMHVAEPPAPAPGAQSVNEFCGPRKVLLALGSSLDEQEFFDLCAAMGGAGCGATYGIWGEPEGPTPGELARTLWAQLPLAPPDALQSNPPAGGGGTLVRFPTWFWAAGGTTGEQSAQTPDGVVRVVARPSYALSSGDGATVVCDGPGTPYDGRDARASSPDCGHTYDRSGRYTATFTLTWAPAWYLGGVEQTGDPLDPLVQAVSTDLAVRESQAVVTRTP